MDYHYEGTVILKKLINRGLYRKLDSYNKNIEGNKTTLGYSYPIKAFEKFLGYYDNYNKIAYNPSISFNTDFSLCFSACMYINENGKDSVFLDGAYYKNTERYGMPLNFIKKELKIDGSFIFFIRRYRKYENAKGMSESSAVASAVARSIVKNVYDGAYNDDSFVSRYARLVSGSGTRASVNGPSMWLSYPGINERDSFAFEIPLNVKKMNYYIFPKAIEYETANAHKAAVESIFYEKWLDNKYSKINEIIDNEFPLNILMKRSMDDMFNLNSVLLSSGNVIQTPESINLLKNFLNFRSKNNNIYITGDTGPSLMVMSEDDSLIKEFLNTVDDFYIRGSHNPDAHNALYKKFEKEANEYFDTLKI